MQIQEIRAFLTARSGEALPETAVDLLNEAGQRAALLHDRGLARLIECADSELAALIAYDPRTRKHCMRAGERHLVVAASAEAAFRRALRETGYLLATGKDRAKPEESA